MGRLRDILLADIEQGSIPGAVGLVAHGGQTEFVGVGWTDVEGSAPVTAETIFRIASVTKPITAAALLILIEDRKLALDDPIATWLPELATPSVARTPTSPIDDLVPLARPITVLDLLTFRVGWGFPADFSLPAVLPLFDLVQRGVHTPQGIAGPDDWLAELARIPLLHQPSEGWLYNTGSDLQGLLIARITGQSVADFLAERMFEPLGMIDTGFMVPAAKLDRFTSSYQPTTTGELELLDRQDGQWSLPPAFQSGAGGLVSTAGDLLRFARMLLADGIADGQRLLSTESVRQMTTDHLTEAERAASTIFLEGQGWGFGGSVDIASTNPWNVPGRYGWVGGTGTALHLVPATDTVTVLLTQRAMTGPTPTPIMREFWRHAASQG